MPDQKVLIIDDSPDMHELVQLGLAGEPIAFISCRSGEEGLAAAIEQKPDLILLDVELPGLDGFEVCRRIKANPLVAQTPIVFLTGASSTEEKLNGLDAGATDYIIKPFDPAELRARVRSSLHTKRLMDLLAHKSIQQAQTQRLESIGQLAAGIAHEINTPAQYVGDNIRFLQQQFDGLMHVLDAYASLLSPAAQAIAWDDRRRDISKTVDDFDFPYMREQIPLAIAQSIEGIERIGSIVRAMKEFSHPGSACNEAADLNRAISTTIEVCRNRWKAVADLQTELDPHLPLVPCFLGEFNQVILNLIVNAADAIGEMNPGQNPDKGLIRISSGVVGSNAEIRVTDNGPGIPDEVKRRIFDPFFTTKQVGKGTGQGLTLSRNVIVNKHGGELFFESAIGAGTTFVIRLPLAGNGIRPVAAA